METALRRIADALMTFVDDTVARYGGEAWWPSNWPGITWALLAVLLVLLWVASRRRRRPRGLDVRPPQLLVTNGEVVPVVAGEGATDGRGTGRRRRLDAVVHADSGTLAMTVSNLSRYPVQVLEVALRDEPRGAPRVVAVDAVVPAMGSVTVEGPVPLALRGDGWLDLYCYAAATRAKLHRHRVELVWEPWSARFKVAPLEQVVVAVRRLASDEPRARFLDDAVVGAASSRAHRDAVAAPAAPDADGGRRAVVVDVPPVVPEAPRTVVAPAPRDTTGSRTASARVAPQGPDRRAVPADPAPPAARADAGERPGPRRERDGALDDHGAGALEVPRIATPPIGVAVTGRGGIGAHAPGGHPIGRPRAMAASATSPEAEREAEHEAGREATKRVAAPGRAEATPEGAEPSSVPASEPAEPASEPAAPRSDVSVRRPRLEFPDEF